jgi:hypothetical protein
MQNMHSRLAKTPRAASQKLTYIKPRRFKMVTT